MNVPNSDLFFGIETLLMNTLCMECNEGAFNGLDLTKYLSTNCILD